MIRYSFTEILSSPDALVTISILHVKVNFPYAHRRILCQGRGAARKRRRLLPLAVVGKPGRTRYE